MRVRYLTPAAAAMLAASSAGAQSASEKLARGDSAHQRLQPAEALRQYRAALGSNPMNYEALWKASRNAIDLAEFERDKKKRTALFKEGRQFAEQAVAVNPDDAEGHFALARALGRVALTVGVGERVRYATEVRAHALNALEWNPEHAGALHVVGMWNAEIMRLSGVSRFVARNFLGGAVLGQASWENAIRYMERAVAVDPVRLVHRLDLAGIYADRGERAKAREQLELVISGTATDYNDRFYKAQARRELEELRVGGPAGRRAAGQ